MTVVQIKGKAKENVEARGRANRKVMSVVKRERIREKVFQIPKVIH
jgi:hypothetical protein